MTSSRPYLIRAMYDWIVDNGMTPHLLVDAEMPEVIVPRQYVDDGKIVLNVAPAAVDSLRLENDYIGFRARFAGTPMEVMLPVSAVMAIYARENGQGMMFSEGDERGGGDERASDSPSPDKPTSSRSHLKVIK